VTITWLLQILRQRLQLSTSAKNHPGAHGNDVG
jgi:hypothetical protein